MEYFFKRIPVGFLSGGIMAESNIKILINCVTGADPWIDEENSPPGRIRELVTKAIGMSRFFIAMPFYRAGAARHTRLVIHAIFNPAFFPPNAI